MASSGTIAWHAENAGTENKSESELVTPADSCGDPWTNEAMIKLSQNSSHTLGLMGEPWTTEEMIKLDQNSSGAMIKLKQNFSHPWTNRAN